MLLIMSYTSAVLLSQYKITFILEELFISEEPFVPSYLLKSLEWLKYEMQTALEMSLWFLLYICESLD